MRCLWWNSERKASSGTPSPPGTCWSMVLGHCRPPPTHLHRLDPRHVTSPAEVHALIRSLQTWEWGGGWRSPAAVDPCLRGSAAADPCSQWTGGRIHPPHGSAVADLSSPRPGGGGSILLWPYGVLHAAQRPVRLCKPRGGEHRWSRRWRGRRRVRRRDEDKERRSGWQCI